MRTADEVRERLQIYTQALYFSHAHRDELSPESLAKHRALEENIGLLQWCLAPPDPSHISWGSAGRTLRFALGLIASKALSCIGFTPRAANPPDTPK